MGISGKLIYRSVGPLSAYGAGLDLGLRYTLLPGFTVAATVRDISTTPIVWATDVTDRINPSLLLGMAYTRSLAGGRLSATVASRNGGDAADAADQSPLNTGVEYSVGRLALRAGLEESRTALGLGLQIRHGLELDVAYLQHDELEATYLFSAGFRF